MTNSRLKQIKEDMETDEEVAQSILEGDHDNYDGADGARTVLDLCSTISELIKYIEENKDA